MKTVIKIEAEMTNEQCEALLSEINRTNEAIGIKTETETKIINDVEDTTTFDDYEVWHFVGDRLPKNESFMCIVQMFNHFSDTWSTGTGVFNAQSNEWEATDSCGEKWPVRYWRRCPDFEGIKGHYTVMKESSKVETKSSNITTNEDSITVEDNEDENIKAWIVNPSGEFQSGNIVRAKIGGPNMGVTKVFDKELECIYYVNGSWVKERFPLDMMIKIDAI